MRTGTGTGLYEYVRKGHALIEAGKYKKALGLFKKAYAESPQNLDIRDNLVYAYLKAAAAADYDGRTGDAVALAKEAYGAAPDDSGAIFNLAYYYCKQGIDESENGRFDDALQSLSEGVNMAMKSKRARKSVSNYLYNMSVRQFNKNDHNTALLCLKSSYALWNRFETLDLLAESYNRKSRPDMAAFYWSKALSLEPDNTEVARKLRVAERDIDAKRDMSTVDAKFFDIRADKDYVFDKARIGETLEGIYGAVGRDLGCYPAADTPLILYDEEDFRDVFEQPYIVQGFYDGSIRIPAKAGADEELFTALMAHEYTHAVISIVTDGRCPLWLNEGIACYEQSRYAPMPTGRVQSFLAGGGRLTLEGVDRGFMSLDTPERAALSYEGAYTAVLFMLDKWGWDGVRGLLARIKSGRHYANAIDEEFLISSETFEDLWNEYARQRTSGGG
ncbi:MAG: tetratricopeptide repeat protein [Candidatus Omnitrophota bacterium]